MLFLPAIPKDRSGERPSRPDWHPCKDRSLVLAGIEEQEKTGNLCSASAILLAGTIALGICDSPMIVPIETNDL